MKKSIIGFSIFALLCSSAHAIDQGAFEENLGKLSSKVERTLKELSRGGGLDKSTQVSRFLPKNDQNRIELQGMINEIQSQEELKQAYSLTSKLVEGNSAQKYVADVVSRMLKKKEVFLRLNDALDGNSSSSEESEDQISRKVQLDTFLRPDEFIAVEVSAAEGSVSLLEKGDEERLHHFQGILDRHECDVISQYHWDDGDDRYNYNFSCKEFVVDTLVEHFEGYKGEHFDLHVELTSGSWLFRNEGEFQVSAPEKSSEKGTLGWYRAVVENNPFQYALENNLMNMETMGKFKDIAGDKTLLVKNAKFKLWVTAPGQSKSHAIYMSEGELGDLSLKGGQQ